MKNGERFIDCFVCLFILLVSSFNFLAIFKCGDKVKYCHFFILYIKNYLLFLKIVKIYFDIYHFLIMFYVTKNY